MAEINNGQTIEAMPAVLISIDSVQSARLAVKKNLTRAGRYRCYAGTNLLIYVMIFFAYLIVVHYNV